MAILRGQDGPDIPMMGCIPTDDSTVFTYAGRMACFFENVKTLAYNDSLLEVFRRAPNFQEHPTCEKNGLFNDGCVFIRNFLMS